MSEPTQTDDSHPSKSGFLKLLERGDQIAHFTVSALLLLAALAVLATSTYSLILDTLQSRVTAANFPSSALDYLSNLLFAVILLELLSTLLTYIKSRNLESTIKDFLVVGIISSVRKILLVGAHSSLVQLGTDEFLKEAIGTAVTILGILLLIGGLLFLEKGRGQRKSAEGASVGVEPSSGPS